MTRHIRQTLIRAALEASYGGVTTPTLTDALLVSNPSHRIIRSRVPRDLVRPYYGSSEELIAARVAEIKFEVELAGSGAVETQAAWGKLMRACGLAETVISTAPKRVEYSPVTDNHESLFIQYFIAGVRYSSKGCRGTVKIKLPAFGLPKAEFIFLGFDTSAAAAAIPGNYDLSAWKRPEVLTDEMAGDIRVGGTFANGQVSGGTVLASRGLEVDLGNQVEHMELLGGERISITGRDVTGRMSTALSAADEVSWRTEINANGNVTLGFNWGTTVGNRGTIWMPQVQRVDPQGEDYKGDYLLATQLRVQPTAAGNDDFVLVMR